MRTPTVRSVASIVFVLALVLGANSNAVAQTPAAAAGGKGPDVLGVRTGMSPQEVYEVLKNIDPAKRVTVGQVPIPPLLGDKAAVYGMAPENLNSSITENVQAYITLPPNPQQVWRVHRQLSNSIHTTGEQLVASLREKYGQEYYLGPGAVPGVIIWLYDQQGRSANGTRPAMTLKNCVFSYMQASGIWNFPGGVQFVLPGVLPGMVVNSPVQISTLLDPTKNPPCPGLVMVRAEINGGVLSTGVYNYNLDVTLTDYTIQNNSAYALNVFLENLSAKKQQQDLDKAKAQSGPKL
jgi:hypothetical protein